MTLGGGYVKPISESSQLKLATDFRLERGSYRRYHAAKVSSRCLSSPGDQSHCRDSNSHPLNRRRYIIPTEPHSSEVVTQEIYRCFLFMLYAVGFFFDVTTHPLNTPSVILNLDKGYCYLKGKKKVIKC